MFKKIIYYFKNKITLFLGLIIIIFMSNLSSNLKSLEIETQNLTKTIDWQTETIIKNKSDIEQILKPKVTSNEDFNGDKTHFTYSPDKTIIAFVQNVFDEYGNDWGKYWAVKIYNIDTKKETTLLVDDSKMSAYIWLDDHTIRASHNGGTGVPAYVDIPTNSTSTIFTKNTNSTFWTLDIEFIQHAQDVLDSQRIYMKESRF